MIFFNYIKNIIRSLVTHKNVIKDFLLVLAILICSLKIFESHKPIIVPQTPKLEQVSSKVDNAGKLQTTVPVVIYTQSQMKAVTAPLKKELKVSNVNAVTTDVVSVKIDGLKVNTLVDTTTYISVDKTHWFKPDEYSIKINHSNPLFKDTLASSYTFKEDKIQWVVGPSVGIGLGISKGSITASPTIGISLTYNLLHFKKKK